MRLRFVSQGVRLSSWRDDEALVMDRAARSGSEIPVLACTSVPGGGAIPWEREADILEGREPRWGSAREATGSLGRAISIESTPPSVGDEPRTAPRLVESRLR